MAATHPAYNLMKMPGSNGVLTVPGDTEGALQVLKLALKTAAAAWPVDTETSKPKGAALTKKKQLFTQDKAETKQILVDEDGSTNATFTIGANLDPEQEEALVRFLCANKKVFAWEPDQLAGVPRDVIEHHLNVCPNVRPVKQKARRQSTEKQAFIVQETRKLEAAGVIHDWLANPIVVLKKGGKERMCVDFTNLNKACPQDHSHSLASTRSSNPPPSVTCCVSWMPSPATTRSSWTRPMP